MKEKILTICIPTYNRAAALKENIILVLEQLKTIEEGEVEFIVSDNCSTDETYSLVSEFVESGAKIIYNRNDANLGSTGNFLKCMHLATGKYILLLGDDDYLASGALRYLISCLKDKNYGLLHIDVHSQTTYPLTEYFDNNVFLKKINRQFTWMSGNVFRKDIVKLVNPSKYMNSFLLQMPYFLTSALENEVNAITGEYIIAIDAGQKHEVLNHGESYNFIKIFANNYLWIMSEYIKKYDKIADSTYAFIKRKMYEDWISKFIKKQLFKVNRKTPLNWFYALKCYGFEGYFYKSLFSILKK